MKARVFSVGSAIGKPAGWQNGRDDGTKISTVTERRPPASGSTFAVFLPYIAIFDSRSIL
jgi:hypothetical protein